MFELQRLQLDRLASSEPIHRANYQRHNNRGSRGGTHMDVEAEAAVMSKTCVEEQHEISTCIFYSIFQDISIKEFII